VSVRVLVVEPHSDASLDRLAAPLRRAGLTLEVARPYVAGELPDRLDADGVVVLGGPMGATDDRDHPWLVRVRGLLREAVRANVPTLGICLGAQLLACACGGRVVRGGAGAEAGVVRVRLRPEARADPLFSTLPSPFFATSVHFDVIEVLPPGAVWLGHSDMYPHQAFRVGEAAWGVQFHPEMSRAGYRSWVDRYQRSDAEIARRTRKGLAEIGRYQGRLTTTAAVFADRYAAMVKDLTLRQQPFKANP
jgi:GMP synthase (glutamine-hydrolysing)